MTTEQITGIISNWDKIEADVRAGIHEDYGKSKDIQDILDLIHDLQVKANTVTPLRDQLSEHIADLNNPHKVTINLSELDLVNTLYALYTERFGITMSLSDFGYALINVKRLATRSDVDHGTHPGSIVNLDVANYIIGEHNVSPYAHADLFRQKIPGIPLPSAPIDSLEPNIFVSIDYNVDRNCPMNYHNINGRVLSVPPNVLPVDYAYGRAAAPVFGPHRNILLNSASLNDLNPFGGSRNTTSKLLVITPIDNKIFLLFQESATNGSHGLHDRIVTEEITGINNYLIYVYPLDRSELVINLVNSNNAVVDSALYDCKTLKTQVSSNANKMYAGIEKLPNGWYRCSVTFDATSLDVVMFDINVIQAIDDMNPFNTVYQGVDCTAMAFWQHQLTKTALPVPPIFTMNTPISILGTKISRDFTNIFNPTQGSIVCRYLSPMAERFGIKNTILRIGHNSSNPKIEPTTSIDIQSNPIDPSHNRITTYDMNNNILELIDSNGYDANNPTFMKRVVFTYTLGYQGYGFTNQSPIMMSTSIDEIMGQMLNFFTDIYDGTALESDVEILQLPSNIDISQTANDITLPIKANFNSNESRLNMNVNVLELGYNSITNTYLEGYLMTFKYYSVFSSYMNIEFLLDQYVPQTIS